MQLRSWQIECANKAIEKFSDEGQHFLCLATPGAGKTIMTAEVVKRLFKAKKIDFVICFAPSITTSRGMKHTIEKTLDVSLSGKIGARGVCVTYQSLSYQDANFWDLFHTHRTLAVFDEIHHCSGNNLADSNIWGQHILVNIQNKATYTLALSGTPWRSDSKPVTLSKYSDDNGQIVCDYEYGLETAIVEGVCRTPHVTVIDNNCIVVDNETTGRSTYKSIELALKNPDVPYQSIVGSDAVIEYCLKEADKSLKKIRAFNPNAAGLVVASSIEHANNVARILKTKLTKLVQVVNYRDSESGDIIEGFQNTDTEWLVSVGMVSEGTNIPRLQVCCHLTRIKTELHFRQILGRIMRVTAWNTNREAHLFAPAQPSLVEFAKRLAADIPDVTLATIIDATTPISIEIHPSVKDETRNKVEEFDVSVAPIVGIVVQGSGKPDTLDDLFFKTLLFSGSFTKELIGY